MSKDTTIVPLSEYQHTDNKIHSPYCTIYEYAALIGRQVHNLYNQDEVGDTGPYDVSQVQKIAIYQVDNKMAPLVVRRRIIGGYTEDWLLKDLILPKK